MNRLVLVILALVALVGCTEGTKPSGSAETAARKPTPEAITARVAFQKMFPSARLWASDAQPFRVSSEPVPGFMGRDGKSAVWRASFASAARGNIKMFTWSGAHTQDAPAPGVTASTEDTYNPRNSETQAFELAFWKLDTDKAFEMAQLHGGDKLLKATPDMPVIYLLDWNPKSSQLVWHVMYGGTGIDSKLRIAVDASTGNYLRTEK